MPSRVSEWIRQGKEAYRRLSRREQLMVVFMAGAVVLFSIYLFLSSINNGLKLQRANIARLESQVAALLQMEGVYKQSLDKQNQLAAKVGANNLDVRQKVRDIAGRLAIQHITANPTRSPQARSERFAEELYRVTLDAFFPQEFKNVYELVKAIDQASELMFIKTIKVSSSSRSATEMELDMQVATIKPNRGQ